MALPSIFASPTIAEILKGNPEMRNGKEKGELQDQKWRNILGVSVTAEAESPRMPIKYTEIVVIRHGETTWNAEKKLQGQLDVELSELGEEQATAVANRLSKETKVSAVYTSDLKRAVKTAQKIATACGVQEVVEDKALRERHLGDLQGLKLERAAELKPEAYKAFVSRSRDEKIPGGGESLNEVYKRCITAVEKIGEEHRGERVVLVTHGGVINAMRKRALSQANMYMPVENASVSIFLLSSGHWSIDLWNNVHHLDDMKLMKGSSFKIKS